ncbi:hypothetical protein GVH93_20410 [Escherichia coli]|uniref:hypothetical protein n=2 Tax=Escherichia coli TaxID=562 RepID=UPI0018848E05|nr:hypothetical protein [Escherichia coli]EKR4921503.1 hypothetical protein [Escherichia coli]ELP3932791.1 hypothetical protein [Escherichia coli]MBE9845926.1 hypothetical protein [Escherichia coli]MCF7410897.1 hypothetical protein [Escherichia coli]MCI5008140.1 hypothetical protein [Escherichia coli]
MTQYDAKLYRKMATMTVNEIFIKNKYPNDYIVHFQKITDLGWPDLQQFISNGINRFDKLCILYDALLNDSASWDFFKGERLPREVVDEITHYMSIYHTQKFSKHYEINNWITQNDLWERFRNIRSINHHVGGVVVKGIRETYFKITCRLLAISDEGGSRLEKCQPW